MAKAEVTVTQNWQQIATGVVTVTILEKSKEGGAVLLNEIASDVAAYRDYPEPGKQFVQNQALATFIRAQHNGWRVIVDGDL